MGGNLYGIGNMTLTAEFNFWFDWDAAFKVVNGISKSVSNFFQLYFGAIALKLKQ